jgi:hypothetical protein
MTAIEQTAQLFQARGLILANEVSNYAKFGYALFTPRHVMMAREIHSDKGMKEWVTDGSGDCWYVFWACGPGAIDWFVRQAPHPKKYVAWHRWKDLDHNRLPSLRLFSWDRIASLATNPLLHGN